ncbi:unnamed protein product, partial [Didymodactylos carnosus]
MAENANTPWLDIRGKTPDEMPRKAPVYNCDHQVHDKILGSMFGMATGDAVEACVEFRPHSFMVQNPVDDLRGGGTWGLNAGQWTDDTSMALCLAASLIAKHGFNAYDQLVRYKWWYRDEYMSSTGRCFDIGKASSDSIEEFARRQQTFAQNNDISNKHIDYLSERAAGNGALMRLAPVPLFFWRSPPDAINFAGQSALLTHGDIRAADACRYYAALICAALHGYSKPGLLSKTFYLGRCRDGWFGKKLLLNEIVEIAEGSYKQPRGYDDGIRAGGYILKALQAALWAFWCDGESFEKGVLLAVNLGDDTDTVAAIYGQLAGAVY